MRSSPISCASTRPAMTSPIYRWHTHASSRSSHKHTKRDNTQWHIHSLRVHAAPNNPSPSFHCIFLFLFVCVSVRLPRYQTEEMMRDKLVKGTHTILILLSLSKTYACHRIAIEARPRSCTSRTPHQPRTSSVSHMTISLPLSLVSSLCSHHLLYLHGAALNSQHNATQCTSQHILRIPLRPPYRFPLRVSYLSLSHDPIDIA